MAPRYQRRGSAGSGRGARVLSTFIGLRFRNELPLPGGDWEVWAAPQPTAASGGCGDLPMVGVRGSERSERRWFENKSPTPNPLTQPSPPGREGFQAAT